MIRIIVAILIVTAICSVGYGFWMTFEPIDNTEPVPEVTVPDARLVDRLLAPGQISTPTPISDINTATRQVQQVVQATPEVEASLRRVHRVVSHEVEALSDIQPAEILETAKEEGKAAMVELDRHMRGDKAIRRVMGGSRIHPSGAPPQDGGGLPGTARQPGIDWYRAGGE